MQYPAAMLSGAGEISRPIALKEFRTARRVHIYEFDLGNGRGPSLPEADWALGQRSTDVTAGLPAIRGRIDLSLKQRLTGFMKACIDQRRGLPRSGLIIAGH